MYAGGPVAPERFRVAVEFDGDLRPAAPVRQGDVDNPAGEVPGRGGAVEDDRRHALAGPHLDLGNGAFLTLHDAAQLVWSRRTGGAVHLGGAEAVDQGRAPGCEIEGGIAEVLRTGYSTSKFREWQVLIWLIANPRNPV
jgi:hypothetical protein